LTRAEFLAERQTGVGGSDAASVFSLPPYGCARRLWYEKRGTPADNERDVTGPMIRGQKLEAIIAEEYAERTGRQIEPAPTARHPEMPEWMVHRDFITWASEENPAPEGCAGPGPLSVKTASRDVFFKMKREGLSDGYILQLQSEIGVTAASWGSFVLLWPDGWKILWWDVTRDDELIAYIRKGVENFWHLVQDGPPPDRLDVSDPRCDGCEYEASCQGAEMQRLIQIQGAIPDADPSLAGLVAEYQEANRIVKDAEEYKSEVAEQLRQSVGDRIKVVVPIAGFRKPATIHFKPNMEWDTERLERERPDIAARFKCKWDLTALGNGAPHLEKQFKRASTTRPLRVYEAK